MVRAALFAAIGLVLVGCGGQVSYPPASDPSTTVLSSGELAIAKLACKRYPNMVLPAKQVIYQLQTFNPVDYTTLIATFNASNTLLAGLGVPPHIVLLSDLTGVRSSLSTLSSLSTQSYRRITLGPAIRAFQTSDLAVSADCQAILTS